MARQFVFISCISFLVILYIRLPVKRGISLSGVWRDSLGYTTKRVQKSEAVQGDLTHALPDFNACPAPFSAMVAHMSESESPCRSLTWRDVLIPNPRIQ
jgi:hypothetical protein